MKTTRLLTLQYLSEILERPIEDIALAAMQDPPITPLAEADGTRIYDRESADIIRRRLQQVEVVDDE